MGNFFCPTCQSTYALDSPRWSCECGGLLSFKFTPTFPQAKISKRKPTMWRYREALPIDKAGSIISFDEGFTPLLAVEIAGKQILIKQEQHFPTGSFKDRGASLLVSYLKSLGITNVVEDSSGNAGSAIAAYCAKAGIACEIYVPESTSPGKLAQIQAFGATLRKVPGSREATTEAVMQAAADTFYASHIWHPFFFQGTKTFAFEIWEQLGWQAPDTVVIPSGGGTLLLGTYIGFQELHQAGAIAKLPKLIAVQAANCAPLYKAFKGDSPEIQASETKETLAEGIAIAAPARGNEIISAVVDTGGEILTVTEKEIKTALQEMAAQGFYIEPTSACTIAGLKKYLVAAGAKEQIVSVFTGNGLKATDKILKLLNS